MSDKPKKPMLLLASASANSVKLVSKHLQALFRVITADDAEAAWDALMEHKAISLVISDLELVIGKFGLLERIRSASDSWLAATPVLLLIGENDSDAGREMAFQMGATDFINLPFASSELTTRVRLHANLYLQQGEQEPMDSQAPSSVNLLQQLSQQNYFDSRAQQELSFSQRHRSHMSICKLKLANTKQLLAEFDKSTAIGGVKAVAKIIQQTLRREDSLCYLGNAEFYLLYPAVNGIGATTSLKRIIKSVAASSIRIGGKAVPLSLRASVYSCIVSEDIDLEHIYDRLDSSLKVALAAEGGDVVNAGPAVEQRAISIDRALKLIQSGRTEELSGQAGGLVLSILPVLEFGDRVLELGLESVSSELRQQLQSKIKREI